MTRGGLQAGRIGNLRSCEKGSSLVDGNEGNEGNTRSILNEGCV